MRNFKLTLQYDGLKYRGWQSQKDEDNTIQTKLETLLSRLLDEEIEVIGAGRTDAGVHARAMVCNFKSKTRLSKEQLLAKIREYLPHDIGAISLEVVPDKFHSRFSAKAKTYKYRIWTSDNPCVFERNYVYRFMEPLDVAQMQKAAEYLMGEHDFTAFTTNKHMKKSAVRNVDRIDFEKTDDELIISFHGDGFLYNMVRIMTGTLLEVGTGKKSPEDIPKILESKIRENAGFTAPAHGLILYEIEY